MSTIRVRSIRRGLLKSILALVYVSTSGCAALPLIGAAFGGGSEHKVEFSADPELNAGSGYLLVRVYELKDAGAFRTTTANALWTDAANILASDLIGTYDVSLRVGGKPSVEVPVSEETRFLGVAGDFAGEAQQSWQLVVDVGSGRKKVKIVAGADGLRLTH